MTAPVKVNFKIYQGSTFKEVLRWESSTKVYKPITGISQAAPCVLNVVGNGIPVGWRFRITNVKGMKEINSTSDAYYVATSTTTDTVTVNNLNSIDFTAYTGGGILEYNEPMDLTGITARMQIREKLESTVFLLELTTENGGITIDTVNKTISINIAAAVTAEYSTPSAVYSMELINGTEVIPFVTGSISLVKEVTR